jgi:uncharacterized membrane protein YgdD (TMEM256/DUF423 family)
MPRIFLLWSSINAFLAVGLGAFAAHGLRDRLLAADLLTTFQTGVQYHMYHSLALFGVAILSMHFPTAGLLRASGYLFLIGIVLFSGSLYFLSLSGIRWLGAITPIGGVAFLAAWGALAWFAVSENLTN